VEYGSDVSTPARLIGNPARAAMLDLLLDGDAHSATELAQQAGVSAATASSHLSALVSGGLVTADRVGRQRAFRLAGSGVAAALEALSTIAPRRPVSSLREARRVQRMRFARTCYDHLAGWLGVAVAEAMVHTRLLRLVGGRFEVTTNGDRWLRGLGVELEEARARRRAFVLPCLDWSERRPHVAGALGAALCDRFFDLGWIRRTYGRAVLVTHEGRLGLRLKLGLEVPARQGG
jgi:DNA-binding transcriptional ArsR family regulator